MSLKSYNFRQKIDLVSVENNSIVTIVSAISALIAAVVATIGLFRLKKTEELRGFEAVYRDIARGLKEYRLLEAESPRDIEEQEQEHESKLRVLYSEFLADVSWLCYLIRHGQIEDETLVGSLRDQIIDWYFGFVERRPLDFLNLNVFPDFQILANRFIYDNLLGVKRHWYTKVKYAISRKNYYY